MMFCSSVETDTLYLANHHCQSCKASQEQRRNDWRLQKANLGKRGECMRSVIRELILNVKWMALGVDQGIWRRRGRGGQGRTSRQHRMSTTSSNINRLSSSTHCILLLQLFTTCHIAARSGKRRQWLPLLIQMIGTCMASQSDHSRSHTVGPAKVESHAASLNVDCRHG
jgi:hypothetical protein